MRNVVLLAATLGLFTFLQSCSPCDCGDANLVKVTPGASSGIDYQWEISQAVVHSNGILVGKWIDHFNCEIKKAKFKAENVDGVGTPARLSNVEI